MARRRPTHATMYDFRDRDLMLHLHDGNGGLTTHDLADMLGFDAEEGGRPVGIRLAWMKRYGMVIFDDRDRTWQLSRSGKRVTDAQLKAPQLRVVEELPDETLVEAMSLVLSRGMRGDSMLQTMLRREFAFGTGHR